MSQFMCEQHASRPRRPKIPDIQHCQDLFTQNPFKLCLPCPAPPGLTRQRSGLASAHAVAKDRPRGTTEPIGAASARSHVAPHVCMFRKVLPAWRSLVAPHVGLFRSVSLGLVGATCSAKFLSRAHSARPMWRHMCASLAKLRTLGTKASVPHEHAGMWRRKCICFAKFRSPGAPLVAPHVCMFD